VFSPGEEVMEAPADSNLSPGDLVVAVVWRPDYDQAADALTQADPGRLAQLITCRVTPEAWPLTLRKGPEEIKIVIDTARRCGERCRMNVLLMTSSQR
jgi:hypothetical protein